jgi:hypothetical protein
MTIECLGVGTVRSSLVLAKATGVGHVLVRITGTMVDCIAVYHTVDTCAVVAYVLSARDGFDFAKVPVRAGRAVAVHKVFRIVVDFVIVKLEVIVIRGTKAQLTKAAVFAVECTIRELLFLLVLAMGPVVSFLTLARLAHLTVVVV